MDCRLDNGYVLDSVCWTGCFYSCYSGYMKVSSDYSGVYCDPTSGQWLLPGIDSPPCQKVPDYHPVTYSRVLPDFRDIDLPKELPKEPVNTLWQEKTNSYTNNQKDPNAGTTLGSIAGGISGIVILIVIIRIFAGIAIRRKRERRFRQANADVERAVEERQLQEQRRPQEQGRELLHTDQEEYNRRLNADVSRDNSDTDTNQYDDSQGFLIVRIRRFFTITLNPYTTFRNPPEPPPYDAESVDPPAYEESERARRNTSETFSEMYQPEGEAGAGLRQESPPPYVENII